mmetsp:Transcript_83005/g.213880  ORF Transcript_83005/g.213880 Transcript_83005/m.213880 type:complete len:226 (+) Transcript_83005:2725-3402(+)
MQSPQKTTICRSAPSVPFSARHAKRRPPAETSGLQLPMLSLVSCTSISACFSRGRMTTTGTSGMEWLFADVLTASKRIGSSFSILRPRLSTPASRGQTAVVSISGRRLTLTPCPKPNSPAPWAALSASCLDATKCTLFMVSCSVKPIGPLAPSGSECRKQTMCSVEEFQRPMSGTVADSTAADSTRRGPGAVAQCPPTMARLMLAKPPTRTEPACTPPKPSERAR